MQRLRRIEGQVRGMIQMIEADRYCLDEVQQANAIAAAVREVALMILTSHLDAGVAMPCAVVRAVQLCRKSLLYSGLHYDYNWQDSIC